MTYEFMFDVVRSPQFETKLFGGDWSSGTRYPQQNFAAISSWHFYLRVMLSRTPVIYVLYGSSLRAS